MRKTEAQRWGESCLSCWSGWISASVPLIWGPPPVTVCNSQASVIHSYAFIHSTSTVPLGISCLFLKDRKGEHSKAFPSFEVGSYACSLTHIIPLQVKCTLSSCPPQENYPLHCSMGGSVRSHGLHCDLCGPHGVATSPPPLSPLGISLQTLRDSQPMSSWVRRESILSVQRLLTSPYT